MKAWDHKELEVSRAKEGGYSGHGGQGAGGETLRRGGSGVWGAGTVLSAADGRRGSLWGDLDVYSGKTTLSAK